jgi:hypothetical protein
VKQLIAAIVLTLALGLFVTPVWADEESWADRINFKGDIRLRYEGVDEEGREKRERGRYRTRFGFTADVQDDIKVVIELSTGGGNPVSTNQTIGDGFSRNEIGFNLAYVDWTVNDSLTINVGKMKNPLFRAGSAPLVWDGDLNPGGAAAKYSSGMFFATAAVFAVEERSAADDSMLYAAQTGIEFPVGDIGSLTAGVGYFAYTNTIGNTPFYDGRARGNTVDTDGNYVYDYKNTEVFAEFDTELGGWPLKVFAQYVQNNEVSVEDTGYAFGAKLGSAKDKGDMDFSWTYQDLEADAVIGTFTDSDFGGSGTDAEGHILKAKYAFSKQISLGGSYFINKKDRFQGVEHDYNRIQIDLEFKFH